MSSLSAISQTPAVWNVPNVLSMARLVLSAAMFSVLPLQWYVAAMVIFIVAAATDWVDGYWARRYGQITQLGRILDPFADKVLITGAFIYLAAETGSGVAPWMAVVIVGRELLITALRSFMEQQGVDFSAKMAGKLKMVFQCVAVVGSLWMLEHLSAGQDAPTWLFWTVTVSVWVAVFTTIYSGLGYVVVAARAAQRTTS